MHFYLNGRLVLGQPQQGRTKRHVLYPSEGLVFHKSGGHHEISVCVFHKKKSSNLYKYCSSELRMSKSGFNTLPEACRVLK